MGYYLEPCSHIRGKVKLVLDFSNYATDTTDADTSKLAAKSNCIALKAGVENLHINKLANCPPNMSNIKNKTQ